jgi:hypothetical protein
MQEETVWRYFMKLSASRLIGIIGLMLGVFVFAPSILSAGGKVQRYRHSDIDMPVSLAVGTVRTPEFAVIHEAYFIMLQVEKPIPIFDIRCMMGLMAGSLDLKDCKKEQLLEADWTVLDEEHIVAQGSSVGWGGAMYTKEHMFKFLGTFMGAANKKYVVEVTFTKDGTPLNVTNPHLIVILVRYH